MNGARAALVSILMIVSGIANQMAFWAAGQKMSGYPMFLLYFCNGLYGLMFFSCLAVHSYTPAGGTKDKEAPLENKDDEREQRSDEGRSFSARFFGTRHEQKYFLIIGVCTGLSLLLQQFANGKVNPDLQGSLYQLFLPATAIWSMIYLRKRPNYWQVSGGTLVFVGVLIAIIPGGVVNGNDPTWVIVYGIASLPLGLASVLQEELFHKSRHVTATQMTAWTTFYGVILSVCLIPVTMVPGLLVDDDAGAPLFPKGATFPQILTHQSDAFSCLLGMQPLPPSCVNDSWIPVVEYSIFYGINVFASILLVREVDAVFVPVVGSFFVPGVAIAAATPWILGLFGIDEGEVTPLAWYVVVGGIILTLGLLIYEGDTFVGRLYPKEKDPALHGVTPQLRSKTESRAGATNGDQEIKV